MLGRVFDGVFTICSHNKNPARSIWPGVGMTELFAGTAKAEERVK